MRSEKEIENTGGSSRHVWPIYGGSLRSILAELVEYEDAEDAGLLVRLPCKVGDTVYIDSRCVPDKIVTWDYEKRLNYDVMPKYLSARVVSFRFSRSKFIKLSIVASHIVIKKFLGNDIEEQSETSKEFAKFSFNLNGFGKTIFRTEDEAEQALKEVQEWRTD